MDREIDAMRAWSTRAVDRVRLKNFFAIGTPVRCPGCGDPVLPERKLNVNVVNKLRVTCAECGEQLYEGSGNEGDRIPGGKTYSERLDKMTRVGQEGPVSFVGPEDERTENIKQVFDPEVVKAMTKPETFFPDPEEDPSESFSISGARQTAMSAKRMRKLMKKKKESNTPGIPNSPEINTTYGKSPVKSRINSEASKARKAQAAGPGDLTGEPVETWECSVCGGTIKEGDDAYIEEDGVKYCDVSCYNEEVVVDAE